ncbi:hypothetical protein MMC21_007959 [Puttea exsequens]|nr:hypothetical protein [Puttea exsequens]
MLAIHDLSSIALLPSGILFLALLYTVSVIIPIQLHQRKIRLEHNCQPLRKYRTRDPILGIDWIWGNISALRSKTYLKTIRNRFHATGSTTFRVRVLHQKAIFTIEPENIKTLLSLRFRNFSLAYRSSIMSALLGKGIFTTDGAEWMHSRNMLRPVFAKEQFDDLGILESHIQDLFDLVPGDRSTIDLQPLFFRFTLDSATDFLFGHSVRTLRRGRNENQRFGTAFNDSLKELAVRFRWGPFRMFRIQNRKASESLRICQEYVDKVVEEAFRLRANMNGNINKYPHEKSVGARASFLQELMKEQDDRTRIRDELLNVLLAGRDTTASLLSHVFLEISRNPSVWRALQEEVAFLQGKVPSYDKLRGLTYVKYCIHESESYLGNLFLYILHLSVSYSSYIALRLHPPVPINTRLCISDTVLPVGGGRSGEDPVFVPKNTLMIYSVHAMHRRQDLFGPDAEIFRPERWQQQRYSWVSPTPITVRTAASRAPVADMSQEYLPFNGGPRICLGQQYAMTEVSYVLVRMVQQFAHIESRDQQPWTESLSLTVCSEHGVKVGLTSR